MKYIPSVSLAVAAYNEQYNIGPFLESVISQKPQGFKFDEIFVISDGSTDNTAKEIYKIMNKYRNNKRNLPKIVFRDDSNRIGKSTRLNQIFKHLKSDYLILADADVIFTDENVIQNLITEFKGDSRIGLVGGNPMPLPPKTFIEKCIDVTFQAYLPIRKNYKNGNSILSATGRIMALRKEIAKKITVPSNTISNDGFTYFANLTLGYKYVCSQEATVYFRSPQNLEDQLSQNTRFQATHAFMKKYFPAEIVDREYFIPTSLLVGNMVKQVIKHPILSLSIFVINRYCQLKALITLSKINALWAVVYTSKKLVN